MLEILHLPILPCATDSCLFCHLLGSPPWLHTGVTRGKLLWNNSAQALIQIILNQKLPSDSNVQPELRTAEFKLSANREAVIIIACWFKKKNNLRKPKISGRFCWNKKLQIKQNFEQHGFRYKWSISWVIICKRWESWLRGSFIPVLFIVAIVYTFIV